MRSPVSRLYAAMLSALVLAGTMGTTCSREVEAMSEVEVQRVFADPGVAELADAVADGDAARIANLAPRTDLAAHGDKNVTLLQWALLNRSLSGMEALLKAGADPRQPGTDGDTVVHLAAMAEDPAYLRVLLAHGADPNAPNGVTAAVPLRSAMLGGRDAQFQALLAAGADPDRADRMGNTPLHVAGQVNDHKHALELLRAGANPAALNTQGVTFQRYLFMLPAAGLTKPAREQREAIETWLREHHVPVEGGR